MNPVIVFEVRGKFAHFRAYDTTRENLSYPFPTRTALLGMIAGIMGFERNSYWNEDHPLYHSEVGIQLLNPIIRTKVRVNYVQTKSVINLPSRLKIIIPQDPFEVKSKNQRGFSAPVNLNLLKDVAYRIFFHINNDENDITNELYKRLKEHKYCYYPYLGHANMLAELELIGKFKMVKLEKGIYNLSTVVPISEINDEIMPIDQLGYTIIFNMPTALSYEDSNLFLKKTEHILFNNRVKEKLKVPCKGNNVYQIILDNEQTDSAIHVSFIKGS